MLSYSPEQACPPAPRRSLDERLVSEAVITTALEVSFETLELDRVEEDGPWRTRRLAHKIAREIGEREGFDLYESLQFIGGVRRAVSNVRLIDKVREELEEVK